MINRTILNETTLQLVDTHIHLNSSIYEGELRALLKAGAEEGIHQWIVPSTVLTDIPRQLEISHHFEGVFNAFGIHPWFVETAPKSWKADLEAAIGRYKPIALGECGLDFSRELQPIQQDIFEKQVEIAIKHDLPLIIHSFKAVDNVLHILRKYPQSRGVFHAINASVQQLEQILALGFYVGFGGAVTFPRAKRLQRLLAHCPVDRILLETDGPYQVGAYKDSHLPNLPVDLIHIARFVAEQKSRTLSEIAKITTNNAIRLFNLEIK